MKIRGVSAAAIFAFLCFGAINAMGQTTADAQLRIKIGGLVNDIRSATDRQAKINAFDINANIDTFALALALRKSQTVFVRQAEEARLDKQVGGGDENSGSTSLTSKGSVPSILGFAVENGALTRDISGTTITFRGNPVGIIKALGKAGFIESYEEEQGEDGDKATRFLRKFSFAISFDTSRGMQTGNEGGGNGANVFTGDRQQLSSYSFRFDILNHRDPRDSRYVNKWRDLIRGETSVMNANLARLGDALENDPAFIEWHNQATGAVAAASDSELQDVILREMSRLRDIDFSPEVEARTESFIMAFNAFLKGRDDILDAVAKSPIITLEYANRREIDLPDLSIFKLIAETGLFKGRADLTANASLTIFNRKVAGQDRIRDFQLSGQLDVPLTNPLTAGNFVLSFSGKYERMVENTMLDNGMKIDTKGDIGIGQIKLTIPVKGSGFKIPISITFANRTEFIKEKEVRGNIGFTFDLDSLFAKFKP
jgi:hypothetical protein